MFSLLLFLSADPLKAFLSEGGEEQVKGLIPQLLTPDEHDLRLHHSVGDQRVP